MMFGENSPTKCYQGREIFPFWACAEQFVFKETIKCFDFSYENFRNRSEQLTTYIFSDMRRIPPYCSPYHYRLDWQLWIETTASLEHQAQRGGFGCTSLICFFQIIYAKKKFFLCQYLT